MKPEKRSFKPSMKIFFLVLNMRLIRRLQKKFNGNHYPQDYLCLAKSFDHFLNLYLIAGGQVIKDITNQHAFTGYSPVLFALTVPREPRPDVHDNITLAF